MPDRLPRARPVRRPADDDRDTPNRPAPGRPGWLVPVVVALSVFAVGSVGVFGVSAWKMAGRPSAMPGSPAAVVEPPSGPLTGRLKCDELESLVGKRKAELLKLIARLSRTHGTAGRERWVYYDRSYDSVADKADLFFSVYFDEDGIVTRVGV